MRKIGFVLMLLVSFAATAGDFNATCGAPVRNVDSVQIIWEGRGASDPQNYGHGWFSMRAIDSDHVMPWGGHSHNARGNNSVRIYDVAANSWRMVHPDVGQEYDRKAKTWSGAAKKAFCPDDPEGCKIVTNRDNHIQWFIPDRHEMVVIGKPAGDVMYGGVYNTKLQKWTVAWRNFSDVGSQGYLKVPADLKESDTWSMNPAHAWVDPDGPGGSPGYGIAYGGNIYGSPRNWMWVLSPSSDPKFKFEMTRLRGNTPGIFSHNRNGAVGAGSCFYMFGGRSNSKGGSDAVWRYSVKTKEWKQMAPMPRPGQWNAAAYDPATNRVVVVSGGSRRSVYLYDLENDAWEDISDQVPMPPASQPTIAHAYGRYLVMAREWHDEDPQAKKETNRIYRFIVAAKTYKKPKITAISMPEGAKGNSYNKAPAQSAKHMSWAYDPVNHRYYSAGGDYGGNPGMQSYRQEIWSWEPETNKWRKELGYCVPDGQVSWMHPDVIGWNFDPSRQGFWFTPGMMPSGEKSCDKGTYYRWQVLFFDPKSGKFTRPPQPPPEDYPGNTVTRKHPLGGDPNYFSAYLPVEDALFRIGAKKVAIFDIKSGKWNVSTHNGGEFRGGLNFRFTRPQVVGRDVYVNDAKRGRLFRFNLDDKHLHLVDESAASGFAYGRELITFPGWVRPEHHDLEIYDLVTGTTATAPVRTPDVMEDDYGTSWTVSKQRKEMFVFGQQKKWGTWFSKFYLIDLSFLPTPGLYTPRTSQPISSPPAGAAVDAAPQQTHQGAEPRPAAQVSKAQPVPMTKRKAEESARVESREIQPTVKPSAETSIRPSAPATDADKSYHLPPAAQYRDDFEEQLRNR